MGALSRYYQGLLRAARVFVPGPGVVTGAEMAFGIDNERFSPGDYGSYLATSNGVYTCARLRAQLLASLPLKIHRLKKNGDKVEVTSGDLRALLEKVNPFWTFGRLIEMTELSLCLWGQAFWLLSRRGTSGVPAEIWWARSDRITVVPHKQDYLTGFLYRPASGDEPIPFKPSEVIWIRYPNPLDEYAGLSPLAAARLAADTAGAAMRSNYNLFRNGVQLAGLITPPQNGSLSEEQARTLERQFEARFRGADKAHRWGVLRYDARVTPMSMSPKDAEFLGQLSWSLEEICRAFGVPLDLVGGQRTYQNVNDARHMLWDQTLAPEARFIATELTEQLLPMFPGQADLAEFDMSGVEVLHEAATAQWTRVKEQITTGAITINEWRADTGLTAVPWGDAWWAPINLTPISVADQAAPPEPAPPPLPPPPLPPAPADQPPDGDPNAAATTDQVGQDAARAIRLPFGDDAHQRAWETWERRTAPHEAQTLRTLRDLFRRQQRSVLDRLGARAIRAAEVVADDPFDLPRWIRTFRVAIRPLLLDAAGDAGQAALDALSLGIAFDVSDPNVARFLEGRAQRFAVQVNQTTWDRLRQSLAEGIRAGEGTDALAARVAAVMGRRIGADAETIARTEVSGAANGGTLLSWKQSGVVTGKRWWAAFDERTRETHSQAHGQTVGIDEDFTVGRGHGPAPGQIGLPEEDVNCRCSISAIIDTEITP